MQRFVRALSIGVGLTLATLAIGADTNDEHQTIGVGPRPAYAAGKDHDKGERREAKEDRRERPAPARSESRGAAGPAESKEGGDRAGSKEGKDGRAVGEAAPAAAQPPGKERHADRPEGGKADDRSDDKQEGRKADERSEDKQEGRKADQWDNGRAEHGTESARDGREKDRAEDRHAGVGDSKADYHEAARDTQKARPETEAGPKAEQGDQEKPATRGHGVAPPASGSAAPAPRSPEAGVAAEDGQRAGKGADARPHTATAVEGAGVVGASPPARDGKQARKGQGAGRATETGGAGGTYPGAEPASLGELLAEAERHNAGQGKGTPGAVPAGKDSSAASAIGTAKKGAAPNSGPASGDTDGTYPGAEPATLGELLAQAEPRDPARGQRAPAAEPMSGEGGENAPTSDDVSESDAGAAPAAGEPSADSGNVAGPEHVGSAPAARIVDGLDNRSPSGAPIAPDSGVGHARPAVALSALPVAAPAGPEAIELAGVRVAGDQERDLPPGVLPSYLPSTGEPDPTILARALLALAGAGVYLRRLGGELGPRRRGGGAPPPTHPIRAPRRHGRAVRGRTRSPAWPPVGWASPIRAASHPVAGERVAISSAAPPVAT